MKKPRKENERVLAAALWALSWERLELPMRGDVWKQRWRSNFCVIILKLITCSEGKICYTNYSWHYPGYLEEYSFIRNLLDFRCVSTDSALRIICNYILVDFLGYFQAIWSTNLKTSRPHATFASEKWKIMAFLFAPMPSKTCLIYKS